MRQRRIWLLLGTALLVSHPRPLAAQQSHAWGRVGFTIFSSQQRRDDGTTFDYSEAIATVTARSASADDGGFEYGVDVRGNNYPSSERGTQVSIYDAFVGVRSEHGRFGLRLGQMWLNDLGGLGSLGGAVGEYRQSEPSAIGRVRLGLFAGAEPKVFDVGFSTGVRKAGAYVAVDGDGARRHVLGYVQIRNGSLTERSVITMLNFIPVGRSFFLYQAAEYDLKGPGGAGSGGLNYIFGNLRYSPVKGLELQALYHRGRSIDARTISDDIRNGRPVDPRMLDGFLFESASGRISVDVMRGVRVWLGYGQDRGSLEDKPTNRVNGGLSAGNLLGSGFDVTVSDSRYQRSTGSYDSVYASLGRSFGRRVYVTLDYTSSLSVFRLTSSGGIVIESRPWSKRYSLSSMLNLSRAFSILLTAELINELDAQERRVMAGLYVRF